MSESTNNNQNIPTLSDAKKTHGSFGAQFKVAREKRQLTLENVADETHVLLRHLEAIENGDFDSLPQKAFTRGFVMSYAKLLKLDTKSIMMQFDQVYPQDSSTTRQDSIKPFVEHSKSHKVIQKSTKKLPIKPFIILLLVVIGFSVIYVLVAKKESQSAVVEAEPTVLESIQVTEQPLTHDTPVATNSSEAVQEQSNAAANTAVTAHTEESTSNNSSAIVAELDFWVKKTTEITVVDQTGTVIMSGTKSRGAHVVKGQAPFNIKIANVKNVNLNMDRVPVKLKRYSVDNKADFVLSK